MQAFATLFSAISLPQAVNLLVLLISDDLSNLHFAKLVRTNGVRRDQQGSKYEGGAVPASVVFLDLDTQTGCKAIILFSL